VPAAQAWSVTERRVLASGGARGLSRVVLSHFGVLVEHRIDDVDEGLVAVEQSVAAGQDITFQPALT